MTSDSDPPAKGVKGFVARRGLFCTVILALFVVLVLGNAAYGLWEVSANPRFCAICHVIEPYVESYYTSQHTDNVHYQADVKCKDCHVVTPADTFGEIWAYVTGSYDDPLPEGRMATADCLRCHRSYEVRIEATSHLHHNPHDGHWPAMECNTCHKAHRPSVDYCGSCHADAGHRIQP